VRFGVLGALAAWTEDGRLVEVREAKVRVLLADLLLSLGRPVPASQLIDDLWGADLPVHPAGALQSKVSRLRQALEAAEPGGGALVAFRSWGRVPVVPAGTSAICPGATTTPSFHRRSLR
jgi:DNA-binding SARP family transcriptional activator